VKAFAGTVSKAQCFRASVAIDTGDENKKYNAAMAIENKT